MTVLPEVLGTGPDGRWHYRRSLTSRVTLLATFAVGLAVTMVALGALITVRNQLSTSLDDSLKDRAQAVAPNTGQLLTTEGVLPGFLLGASGVRIGIVQSSGVTTFLDRQDDVIRLDQREIAVAKGTSPMSLRTVRAGDTDYRVITVPTNIDGLGLVVAQSLEPQQHLLAKLTLVTLFFGIAGIIIAGIAGWGVGRYGMRPVRRLTAAAEDIARTEKLDPIPVEGDDEVARLASAFNQMLVTLAASRDRQRQLVADAGHELRTPLTSLRTNIELLTEAADQLPAQAREELLADVQAQLGELTTLVGDLVELARDEPQTVTFGPVELHEVLDAAVARVRRRGASLTWVVDVEPWYLDGEPPALERALTNVLDNAAKWSPPGGTVHVALSRGTVTVDDEGPGIAEADLPHVFERFYRSSESRAMPGSGLGLSIVAQTAERHAGGAEAGPSPYGGTRVTFWVPGAPSPKPDGPPEDEALPTRRQERAEAKAEKAEAKAALRAGRE